MESSKPWVRMTLPWPPSVNHYWRSVNGRVLLSEDGRRYRSGVERIVQASLGSRRATDRRLSVLIEAFPPDRRDRDIDNIPKAVLDSLEHGGLMRNDSQVDELLLRRRDPSKPGHIEISAWEIEMGCGAFRGVEPTAAVLIELTKRYCVLADRFEEPNADSDERLLSERFAQTERALRVQVRSSLSPAERSRIISTIRALPESDDTEE